MLLPFRFQKKSNTAALKIYLSAHGIHSDMTSAGIVFCFIHFSMSFFLHFSLVSAPCLINGSPLCPDHYKGVLYSISTLDWFVLTFHLVSKVQKIQVQCKTKVKKMHLSCSQPSFFPSSAHTVDLNSGNVGVAGRSGFQWSVVLCA